MKTLAESKRLRCRAEVWERGRWIHSYQCSKAAKGAALMRTGGDNKEELPVCGTHQRHPPMSAYTWSGSPYESRVQEYV